MAEVTTQEQVGIIRERNALHLDNHEETTAHMISPQSLYHLSS